MPKAVLWPRGILKLRFFFSTWKWLFKQQRNNMALTRAGLRVALSLTDCECNTIVRNEAGFPLKPACSTYTCLHHQLSGAGASCGTE